MGYFNAVGEELKKGWWNAVVIIVFTIARLFFGWGWFSGGLEKLNGGWLTDGKFDAGGEIQKMVSNFAHSHGPDPLHLNDLIVWFANHIFLNVGGLTDFLVVMFELLLGLTIFFGFGFPWMLIVAMFLNLQFDSAGAANNFGYLVTDMVFASYFKSASLIGVDGYIRYRRGKSLLARSYFNSSKGSSGTTSAM